MLDITIVQLVGGTQPLDREICHWLPYLVAPVSLGVTAAIIVALRRGEK